MKETHDIKGRLQIRVTDRSGKVVEERLVHNKIVASGYKMVANLFAGAGNAKTIGFFGVGTGAAPTTESTGDLAAPVAIFETQMRKAINSPSKVEPVLDANNAATGHIKVTITGELDFNEPAGIPVDLMEAGLFNTDKPITKKTGGIKPGEEITKTKVDTIPTKKGGAAPPEDLYNRVVFEKIQKTADFKITLIWEILF